MHPGHGDLTRITRAVTLGGWLALVLVLIGWYGIRDPAPLLLIALLIPLAFPLRGLLLGKPYTYAWTSLLILIYFIHGSVEAWANPASRGWALLEVALSVVIYTGAVVYARRRGRELKRGT